ncbi:Multidrug resistance protein MdtA [Vibrio stylophorae]|uniref:Multidrug resistance protein MdtA n=1 Tax=Vibrio stylophorae TaxID=659351 RepID=A0ABN8DVU9_9VIBR|nr:efflux RND transporter periplasmic adaptor subunit [Vibrio stylophorae]CAH0533950.1 Multidrug resistance protein MdtA [Vibrio stylophorae]
MCKRRFSKHLPVFVLFCAFFSVPSWAKPPRGNPGDYAVSVTTYQVQTQALNSEVNTIGKLTAQQQVTLAPEVSGRIDAVLVKPGDQVKMGQMLVRLESAKQQAAVAEALAYWRDEERKRTEFARLAKRGALTQTELDAQVAAVAVAKARLDAARAELAFRQIKAPFDGTVGLFDLSRGMTVNSGDPLMSLDDLQVMWLELPIPEQYLAKLKVGMAVEAHSQAWPQPFYGKLVAIDSRIDPQALTVRIRSEFENTKQALKPGMLMQAVLQMPAVEKPVVPIQSIEYQGTKRYVYRIVDGKAVRTEVVLGARSDNKVMIEQGLDAGATIVLQGLVNMRDGARVMIQEQTVSVQDQTASEERN